MKFYKILWRDWKWKLKWKCKCEILGFLERIERCYNIFNKIYLYINTWNQIQIWSKKLSINIERVHKPFTGTKRPTKLTLHEPLRISYLNFHNFYDWCLLNILTRKAWKSEQKHWTATQKMVCVLLFLSLILWLVARSLLWLWSIKHLFVLKCPKKVL